MTLNNLLTFLVLSQIAMAAYLLYSFNTIERASKKRHELLAAQVEEMLARMEERITGNPRPRSRMNTTDARASGQRELPILRAQQAL